MQKFRIILATICILISMTSKTRADWPKRVFIPYVYLGNDDNFKLTNCDDAIGVKYYTLAFIIADHHRKPATMSSAATSSPVNPTPRYPTWFGNIPMSQNFYGDQIAAIRQRGGDVVCSFGGADGTEIAMTQKDPAALAAQYQAVIDQYKFTWLDFDIEGDNLEKHADANHLRNTALAMLQKKYPNLIISYTLPVDPDGISDASQKVLADAKAQGVVVHSANIMVMYFGKKFVSTGRGEGQLGIDSALKARSQIQPIDPNIQIGLCPCIGTNGNHKEIFTVADAKVLRGFADKTDWICSLSFWSMNRDSELHHGEDTSAEIPGPNPWDFSNTFKSFTTAGH
jgi:hypothetical protein